LRPSCSASVLTFNAPLQTTPGCFCRHPWVSPDAFVAPNATVVGRVDVNTRSSVMYGAVVRGDLNSVSIGAFASIGDRAVISTTKSVEGHASASTTIGHHVLVGPGALLQVGACAGWQEKGDM
jgi:gamma-carbonic anhydrase